jgi:hypothetical protein
MQLVINILLLVVVLCATIVSATHPFRLAIEPWWYVHVHNDGSSMDERIEPLLAVGGGLNWRGEAKREIVDKESPQTHTTTLSSRCCSAPPKPR